MFCIYIHYICKEVSTNDPLDKGGYGLDLVDLEMSFPIPGREFGKVVACGRGAHPNCLCCPGIVGVLKSLQNIERALPACPQEEEVSGRLSEG